ncbi:hypothetical protein cypCar_00043076, partial [Cyprinus carpio]
LHINRKSYTNPFLFCFVDKVAVKFASSRITKSISIIDPKQRIELEKLSLHNWFM